MAKERCENCRYYVRIRPPSKQSSGEGYCESEFMNSSIYPYAMDGHHKVRHDFACFGFLFRQNIKHGD